MCDTIKRGQVTFLMGELILENGWVVVSWAAFFFFLKVWGQTSMVIRAVNWAS